MEDIKENQMKLTEIKKYRSEMKIHWIELDQILHRQRLKLEYITIKTIQNKAQR